MSDRERAQQLLDSVPDYKIQYVIAYLQGVTAGEDEPNEETEMKRTGSGQHFTSLDDLWKSLED